MRKLTLWVVFVSMLIVGAALRAQEAKKVTEQIMVDQFGFRPQSEKIIIFASPQQGQNAGTKYTPPAQATVRREQGGATVLTVDLKPWGGGKTDKTSGDKVWYADISALQTPGTYYVYDAEEPRPLLRLPHRRRRLPAGVEGGRAGLLLPALRRRCSRSQRRHLASSAACHLAAGQDTAAELYIDGRTKGQPRDVHGGWHDAGDYNKYVPFTIDVVHALLMAYEFNPSAFGDDWNIPESGNGIPDILDEVPLGVRLAAADANARRVGLQPRHRAHEQVGRHARQGRQHPRYYTQPTSWATATCAANLAYFSRVIGKFPGQAAYARKCRAAAEKAWAWLEQHPDMTPADGTRPRAAQRGRRRVLATTAGKATPIAACRPRCNCGSWTRSRSTRHSSRSRARTCSRPVSCSTPSRPRPIPPWRGEVRTALKKFLNDLVTGPYKSHADAYLSYLPGYWWGCNQSKSEYGYRAMFAVRLGVNPAEDGICRAAAEDYLHFLHGRNPLCQVYLTNMGPKGANAGAGKSIMRPFHTWFAEKSPWSGPDSLGPAPGLLVGGPNSAIGDAGRPHGSLRPLTNRPRRHSRTGPRRGTQAHQANENSWAFTEPAIYYQARYVLLLSQFVGREKSTSRTALR